MFQPAIGSIGWMDLTVDDATGVRDFYEAVAGWSPSPVDMGGYEDFCMHPTAEQDPVAGVCHARGENAGLPPQWLIYITVADLDASLAACEASGGKIVRPAKSMGAARIAVIADPAGAVSALYQPG